MNKALNLFLNRISTRTLHITRALAAFSLFTLSAAAFSQSSMPSPQQIEQFKNLPRAQQEQLAKQMGFDLSVLEGAGSSATAANNTASVDVVERQVNNKKISQELSRQSVVQEQSKKLKSFGYDLFSIARVSTAFPANTPVPNDYTMGPGDSIKLQLFGKETGSHELAVNNEGSVDIPELGPLFIAGISYNEAKQLIIEKYNQQKIGVQAFVTMGQLKTIQVFLVGEVYRPGTLTLSSLSTVTTALFNSGGVSNIGSLRNIKIKRQGKTVANFDFYDLIVYGNTQNDIRLQQGDVIFVPTVSKIVSIDGEVRRPAIYEMVQGEDFDDLLRLAGGALPSADKNSIQLVRNDIADGLTILSIDSTSQQYKQTKLVNGDFVSVTRANLEFTNAIRVMGAINSPQLVALGQKPQLSDIVNGASVLNNTDLDYGLIVRRAKLDEYTSIIQFSPADVINGIFDYDMRGLDQVFLFNRASRNLGSVIEEQVTTGNLKGSADSSKTIEADFVQQNESESFTTQQLSAASSIDFSRKQLLAPIIARLKSEASDVRPVQLVEVVGQIKFPGVYPVSKNNSLSKVLRAAGGLTESAHLNGAEITTVFYSEEASDTQHRKVSLIEQLSLPENEQVQLASKDVLNVVRIPEWYERNVVTLAGEVVFPGTYQISNGETLSNLLVRAGGLTNKASLKAAVFTREELKAKEQRNIDKAVEDLRQQLANNNLSNSQFSRTIDYDNATKVLDDLTSAAPAGRLVIDLPAIVANNATRDLELKDGDKLTIPNITPAVSIIGEVFVSSTHWYDPKLNIDDYIKKAGGIKVNGDASSVYIVRADGSVFVPENSFWFNSSETQLLLPGDTIVVPRDVTNYDNVSLWQGITQIIYQSAVAIAAVGSL